MDVHTFVEYHVRFSSEDALAIRAELSRLLFHSEGENEGQAKEEYGIFPNYHALVQLYYDLEDAAERHEEGSE